MFLHKLRTGRKGPFLDSTMISEQLHNYMQRVTSQQPASYIPVNDSWESWELWDLLHQEGFEGKHTLNSR